MLFRLSSGIVGALMSSKAERLRARIRATALLLGLSLGWISAPIALAAQSADVCGQSCCIQLGHCCCVPRHARVQGDQSDDKDGFRSPRAGSRCPEGCGNISFSSTSFSRDARANRAHWFTFLSSVVETVPTTCLGPSRNWAGGSSPRAPPSDTRN